MSTIGRFQNRADTAANWTSANPTLAVGEVGYESDTAKVKIGDGTTAWVSLGYFPPSASFVGAKAYHSTTQSLSNATWTAVVFDSEDFDTNAIHSTSSNTSRFTVPTGKGGKWQLTGSVIFAANATGLRSIDFWKNGSSVNKEFVQLQATSASAWSGQLSAVLALSAGDYVELAAFQNSGGSLNASATNTLMSVTYLGS